MDRISNLSTCSMMLEIYRRTTLGFCLQDSLDEMVAAKQICPELARVVLKQYDRSMSKLLDERCKALVTFKGKLCTYNNRVSMWTLLFTDVELKDGRHVIDADKLKVVACQRQSFGK